MASIANDPVCTWLGHASAIAQKHYLQVTDEDFALAAQMNIASISALSPKTSQREPRTKHAPNENHPGISRVFGECLVFSGGEIVPLQGLEP